LNSLIFDAEGMKIRCEAATEGVPAVPVRKRIIALEEMSFGLVFFLQACGKSRNVLALA